MIGIAGVVAIVVATRGGGLEIEDLSNSRCVQCGGVRSLGGARLDLFHRGFTLELPDVMRVNYY